MLGGGGDEPGQVGEHQPGGRRMPVEQHLGGPLHRALLPLQGLILPSCLLISNVLHTHPHDLQDNKQILTAILGGIN